MDNVFDKKAFFEQAVEVSKAEFESIHTCLVLAPHPDDESLGCGGLIAKLKNAAKNVFVILTTDGSQSHPNSKMFPPRKVAKLRKKEVLKALDILGVAETNVLFFNGKDAALPCKDQAGFLELKEKLTDTIRLILPDLILVPYELDPHCDHRATWQLLNGALSADILTKVWEYPIWLYELATLDDVPDLKKGELKKVNIEEYLEKKSDAIASHISQTTKMIDDDPTGFILTDDVIENFTTGFEYFIERR